MRRKAASRLAGAGLLAGVLCAQPAPGRELPSTTQFMNVLTVCGAGLSLTISADLHGSIVSVYEQGRTQGKAFQDIKAQILTVIPPAQVTEVFKLYLDCVERMLSRVDLGPKRQAALADDRAP
jgi:hypothetical protein